MSIETIDGSKLKQMIAGGASSLNQAKEEINSLNVFPVPDGDTGTNMNLTIQSAKEEAEKVNSNHAGEVAKAISKGALMGARGNSGVILSQLFRGFAKELEKQPEVVAKSFVKAMGEGVNTAYKAVMKPVEGTILTVAKDAAKGGQKFLRDSSDSDYIHLLTDVIETTDLSVQKTPDQLPVLKEAGVVDAGGKGLYYIYRGFLSALAGETEIYAAQSSDISEITLPADSHYEEELVYQFCTEFILTDLQEAEKTERELKKGLLPLGDSMLVVAGVDMVKVHIHTNRPGKVLDDSMRFGELNDIKIDNMKQQHESKVVEAKTESDIQKTNNEDTSDTVANFQTSTVNNQIGVISVVNGDGFSEIFRSLGVSNIVTGGQTMNPSTEDLLTAIEQVDENKVVLLPNNKNIILACEQAQKLAQKDVVVVPTKNVPQGISSLMAFHPDAENLEEMKQDMAEASNEVITGEVTYAVRDTTIDKMEIKKDDIISIIDGNINTYGDDPEQVLFNSLQGIVTDEHEIITVYHGVDANIDNLQTVLPRLEEEFPECEIESYYGGQPLYYYTFSVE